MATVREWKVFAKVDRSLRFDLEDDGETREDFLRWAMTQEGEETIWEEFKKNIKFDGPNHAYMTIETVELIEHEVKSTDTDERV